MYLFAIVLAILDNTAKVPHKVTMSFIFNFKAKKLIWEIETIVFDKKY